MTDDNQANGQLRKVKKSETLEVRIPFETKQAFLTACREDGTTASEVVRESVQTYLDERERPTPQEERTPAMPANVIKLPQPVRRYGTRIAIGGLAAAGFVALAVLPSAAAPDFASMFKRLDANGDGVLTAEEFAGPKDDSDSNNVVVETRHITRNGKDATPPRPPTANKSEFKQEAYSFWLPESLGDKEQHQYEFVAQRSVTINSDDKSGATPQPPQPPVVSTDDIRKHVFDTYDTDKDGKISLTEFQARQRAMIARGFEILDTNHDKYLSEAEYAKIVNPPIVKLSADDPDTPDTPRVSISNGGPKISAEAIKAAFAKLDANKDNKLSLQEYMPPA